MRFDPPPYEGSLAHAEETARDTIIPIVSPLFILDVNLAARKVDEIKRAGGTPEVFLTIRDRKA